MVWWFCLISCRFFDIWTPYFGIMSPYDLMFDLNIKLIRSLWPIFHGPVILPYILKTDVWTSYFRIMSQYVPTFDLKINVGHCDLYFMVQWFCLISWLFAAWTLYLGIMNQYDTTFDLKIKGHSDLYFMFQWVCIIQFWRLFDIWTPYFGIMSRFDPTFDLKINVGHYDLYLMVQ